jgi:hypothetical protein
MSLLLETGRTNLGKFCDGIDNESLPVSDPGSSTRRVDFDAFYERVLGSTTGDTLLVTATAFKFGVKPL